MLTEPTATADGLAITSDDKVSSSTRGTMPPVITEEVSDGFLIFAQVFIIIVLVVGVTGNALTIIVIQNWKRLQTVGNFFILHLCITDIVYLLVSLPIRFATFHKREWIFGQLYCCIFGAICHFLYGLSIMTLGAIAVNRLIHVVHPAHYKAYYTKLGIIVQYIVIYVLTFFITFILPVANIWGYFDYNPTILSCTFSSTKDPEYRFFVLGIGVWMPLIFIICCYIRIFIHVRRNHKRMEAWAKSTNSNTNQTPAYPQEEPQLRGNQISPVNDDNLTPDETPPNLQDEQKESAPNKRVSTVSAGAIFVDSSYPVFNQVMQYPSATKMTNEGNRANEVSGVLSGDLLSEAPKVLAPVGILKKSSNHAQSEGVSHSPDTTATNQGQDVINPAANSSGGHLDLIQELSEISLGKELSAASAVDDVPENQTSWEHNAWGTSVYQEPELHEYKHSRTHSVGTTSSNSKMVKRESISSRRSSKKSVTFVAAPIYPQEGASGSCLANNEPSLSNLHASCAETDSPPSPINQSDQTSLVRRPSLVQKNRRQAVHLSAMMLCTFCVYLMCTLPYFIVHVFTNESRFPMAYLISLVLTWLGSCLNPIVYALMNAQFRHAYKSLLGRTIFCRIGQKAGRQENMEGEANSISMS